MTNLKFNEFFPVVEQLRPNPNNPYLQKVKDSYLNRTLPLILGEELRNYKGKWLELINSNYNTTDKKFTKLYIEIGSYSGQTLVEIALSNPEYYFIGLDITFKRVYLIAEKIKKYGISNALCIMANAKFLYEIFGHNELDGVISFFPDPWPKKKHAKYRLFSQDFILNLYSILKMNAFIWLKTDNQMYFNDINYYIKEINKFVMLSTDLYSQYNDFVFKNYYTPFNTLFLKQNKIIYEQLWRKNK